MRYDVILVDMANLAHRTFHTSGELSTDLDGTETLVGMVFGFVRSSIKLYDELAAPGASFILCDEDDASARKEIWSGYKATRAAHRVEYDSQRDLLRLLATQLGWMRAWSPGWEGDDVVATIASHLEEQSIAIVTGDHDLHQCVTERVHVVDPNSKHHDLLDGRAWRRRDVQRKWGVPALRIPDVKALSGDTTDEYPGAPGVGDKTATILLQKFESLDGVLAAAVAGPRFKLDEGKTKKTDAVADNVEAIRTYLDLATVRRDVPLEFGWRKPDPDPLAEFRRLRFMSMTSPSMIRTCLAMAGR